MTARSISCCWRSHIVREPPAWLATDTAVYIGIVYSYLPFMVLPLYATLEKLDESLLEAAADLGCPRWKTFWLVTLPLSAPGVLAGALLCFIPIVGEFVIPDLLGGSRTPMIGQTIWTEFFANKDWPTASAVAVVLVVPAGHADRRLPAPGDARRGARLTMRKLSSFNLAALVLGLAFLYLPIVDSGHLFVQCVAPGRGVGRLVDALVRRTRRRCAAP